MSDVGGDIELAGGGAPIPGSCDQDDDADVGDSAEPEA